MEGGKSLYVYNGSIEIFGRHQENFKAKTWAVSEKKAAQNICYQYKQMMGLIPATKVSLGDKLLKIS